MNVITYEIELKQPLLVTGLEGDPNSSVSYSFIPGSVLRGALIGLYLNDQNPKTLDLEKDLVKRMFFNGETRFLNGYLALKKGDALLPALPVPRSWHRQKRTQPDPDARLCQDSEGNHEKLYDFAREIREDKDNTFKSVGEGYVIDVGERIPIPYLTSPETQVRVHTARNREFGRARSAESRDDDAPSGAVYQYESLQVGQTFIAHILCPDETIADEIEDLLNRRAVLGGARSSDYGSVYLCHNATEEVDGWSELDVWQQASDVPTSLEDEYEHSEEDDEWLRDDEEDRATDEDEPQSLILTLLSDLLLRDKCGQWTTNPQDVKEALGLGAWQVSDLAFMDVRPIGGFNRKWGLPLPQMMAVQMGSVFVFDGVTVAERQHIESLLVNGIGEERVNGFGRIAIDWFDKSDFETGEKPKPSLIENVDLSTDSATKLAETMVKRSYRQLLDRQLLQKAQTLVNDPKTNTKSVKKSQLYRLRLAVQGVLHKISTEEKPDLKPHRDQLTMYVDDLKKRNSTQRQFDRARIQDGGARQPMLKWFTEIITATSLQFNSPSPPQLGNSIKATTDDKLKFEYNLRLIDAVLALLAKKNRETNDDNN